ncbi:hypothetical protein Tco_0421720 [Tanacetum coccineum]
MSQPANDEFSQHLSDDEESNHEDASDTVDVKNFKHEMHQILEAYDIWVMEMEHLLEYIDNDVMEGKRFKLVENGKEVKNIYMMAHSQRTYEKISWNGGLQKRSWVKPSELVDTLSIDDLYNNLRVFDQKIQGVQNIFPSVQNVAFVLQSSKLSTNKVKSVLLGAYSIALLLLLPTNIPEKRRVLAGFVVKNGHKLANSNGLLLRMKKSKENRKETMGTHDGKKKRDSLYQHQEAGKQEKNQMGLLTMDSGEVLHLY